MNTKSASIRTLTVSAIIAAAYAALTMALAPISYGPIQMRVSEVLCIMPFFIPSTAWGLFIGCMLANLLTGNIFDIIFGSLATLLAALCTARLGKREHSTVNCLLACLMPVIFNGLVVGAIITQAYNGMSIFSHFDVFAINCAQVAIGEAVVLLVLGLPLMLSLPKRRFFQEFLKKFNS